MASRNPQYDSLRGIPVDQGAAVYVAEFENGIVKVGYSDNPGTRIKSLHKHGRRHFGSSVRRYFVRFVDGGRRTAACIERSVLTRIGTQAAPVLWHHEYFNGLHFGAAVTLVSQMCKAHELIGTEGAPAIPTEQVPQA